MRGFPSAGSLNELSPIGRGGKIGTLKEMKAGVNRYLERHGMRQRMVAPGRVVSRAEAEDPEWQKRNAALKRQRKEKQ